MFKGLEGKRVLVTGASTGIGAAIVRMLAEAGASIGIHYKVSKAEAEELLRCVEAKGGQARLFQYDFLENTAYKLLIQSFVEAFAGIDILVNNAGGIYGYTHFEELDEEAWDKTFILNAKAPFFLAREAFLVMKSQGGGKIINISSISAKYGGSAKTLHYGASKAALDAITIGLAKRGAPHGILVNSVRGGFVDTPLHNKMGRTDLSDRINLIPLKRAGKPEDIAGMVSFLASTAGDFITGEVFTVAGGD